MYRTNLQTFLRDWPKMKAVLMIAVESTISRHANLYQERKLPCRHPHTPRVCETLSNPSATPPLREISVRSARTKLSAKNHARSRTHRRTATRRARGPSIRPGRARQVYIFNREMGRGARGQNCHRNPCKDLLMRAAPGCADFLLNSEYCNLSLSSGGWMCDLGFFSLQLFAHKYWIFAESEVPVYDLRG